MKTSNLLYLTITAVTCVAVALSMSAAVAAMAVMADSPINFTKHTIADNFLSAFGVDATDVDGDGDVDVLGAAFVSDDITWWENDGNENFTEHTIDGNFDGAQSVYARDVDDDGDVDVLGTAWNADTVAWWENDGNEDFSKHIIDSSFDAVRSLYPVDVDGDGDPDVLGAARNLDTIAWWENDGNGNFSKHTVDSSFDGAHFVYAVDVDGDGDVDVLGTAMFADDIAWWENDGDENFSKHTIDDNFDFAHGVYAADVDGDGDVDVFGTAFYADEIAWWENDGNESFSKHVITDTFDEASSVCTSDLDNDGDVDILGTADGADGIVWWENDGNENFIEHTIEDDFYGAARTYVIDIDGDGDLDFAAAVDDAGFIAWWEQEGVPNAPPVLSTNQPTVAVNEGQIGTNTGTVSDPDNDPVMLSTSVGIVLNNGDGTWSWSFTTTDGPTESRVITIVADDGRGGTSQAQFNLVVNNVAPAVGPISAPQDPVQVNTEVTVGSDFTDPGVLDTHTAVWDWGDDSTSPGTVVESDGSGSVSDSHTYATPGVYTVRLTVTDKDGDSGESVFQYVVVYDPEGGFVTGGGWIDSPEGAYSPDPSLTGKANFGFVSKYKKGADVPTGQTEFQFQVADLNFHSDSYDWLVVAGHKAMYKGTGTINGSGNYGFLLSAIDEDLTPSTDVDLFRIKIWNKDDGDALIYDNQMGDVDEADPMTEIGGGSIVIHKK